MLATAPSSLQLLMRGWLLRAYNIFNNEKNLGAAKKFVRHEYEYEYTMYIDYTRTYIKYKNIMYSMFVTYEIMYVA